MEILIQGHEGSFLRGCRLFDQGQFWAAHEAWEDLWLPVRLLPQGAFYKGLIHYAAAMVHLERAQRRGPRRLLRTAREHLSRSRQDGCDDHGLDLESLDRQIAAFQVPEDEPLPWPPPPLPRRLSARLQGCAGLPYESKNGAL